MQRLILAARQRFEELRLKALDPAVAPGEEGSIS
jgi:hypothetical protein